MSLNICFLDEFIIAFQGWLGSGQRGAVVLDNINITHITEVRFAMIDIYDGLNLFRFGKVDITLVTKVIL